MAHNEVANANADTDTDSEDLDTEWLDQYKAEESNYSNFYKEPTTSIKLYLLYNKEQEIVHVEKSQCLLENGKLSRERLIALIKHYETREFIKYKLTTLIRYNIDLNPVDVEDYVNDNTPNDDRFLSAEKYLNDICYEDSIHMLQDLNALFFIYSANHRPVAALNQTKKITWKLQQKNKTLRNKDKKNLKVRKEIA